MADAPGRDAGVRPAGGGCPVGRRQALAALAAQGGEAALAGQGLAGDGAPPAPRAATGPGAVGYAPDGVAGRKAAFPLSAARLLETPFARNQARNTAYLLFWTRIGCCTPPGSTTGSRPRLSRAAAGRRRVRRCAATTPGT